MNTALVWFKRDLRLEDHTALAQAYRQYANIVPVFVVWPGLEKYLGQRKTAFLFKSLQALGKDFQARGGKLIFCQGNPETELLRLARRLQANAVFWNQDVEPFYRKKEHAVAAACRRAGIEVVPCEDGEIHPPETILKKDGKPYTVFTPYWNKWKNLTVRSCCPTPRLRRTPPVASRALSACFKSKTSCNVPLPPADTVSAKKSLKHFISKKLARYSIDRNFPARSGTSELSVYLAFGILSARQIFQAVQAHAQKHSSSRKSAEVFLSELAWRDFYRMILWHFPRVENHAFRERYADLTWPNNRAWFRAWCEGRTGFPIVDAGMRQLNQTGWMHNRLRMIAASFLVKDLLIDWRWGERYFREKLFDADVAANNGGWQWCAGTGTDAQPYFRIFNPVSQAERFDPEGRFIRRYVPEAETREYPSPLVRHDLRRAKALELFKI